MRKGIVIDHTVGMDGVKIYGNIFQEVVPIRAIRVTKAVMELCYNHLWESRLRCRECWLIKQGHPAPTWAHTIEHGDMPELGLIGGGR